MKTSAPAADPIVVELLVEVLVLVLLEELLLDEDVVDVVDTGAVLLVDVLVLVDVLTAGH